MMKTIRFWLTQILCSLKTFHRLPAAAAGLSILSLVLSLGLGAAADAFLQKGVSFSPLLFAVPETRQEGMPGFLENTIAGMEDVSRYCRFQPMAPEKASAALRRGEADAILLFPENFISGVQTGENPDVTVIVSGDRPLEAMLTLWLGQSAADLLSAVQSGIYGVLEAYDLSPAPAISREQAVRGINLSYISWTLNRDSLFQQVSVSPTRLLPIRVHYGLSLIFFLAVSFAPFFCHLFSAPALHARRRLFAAGRTWGSLYFCDLAACFTVYFCMLLMPLLMVTQNFPSAFLGSLAGAGLCSIFASFCCLLTTGTPACGILSFFTALFSLIVAGGILPPVLLPEAVRNLEICSPVGWLRDLTAIPMGCGKFSPVLIPAAAVFAIAAGLLYARRSCRMEDVP